MILIISKILLTIVITNIASYYIIDFAMKKISPNMEKNKDKNISDIIGVLERTLLLLLFYSSNQNIIGSIGLLITLKTLTRFKLLDDKEFSQYYLAGTLLSIILTLIAYGLTKNFIK